MTSPRARSGEHDTSPHRLSLAGHLLTAQCAALILGFSRYAFIQYYPRFTRFEAQVFLQAVFAFLGGTARRCTIDNTSVGALETIDTGEVTRDGSLVGQVNRLSRQTVIEQE